MNVAGSVARQRDEVLPREERADRLVVPQTRHAEPVQPHRERGKEKNQQELRIAKCEFGGWRLEIGDWRFRHGA